MRLLILSLLVATFLCGGCAKPWSNQDAGDGKKAAAQFDRDSVRCEASAGEIAPLDSHRQRALYNACMEDKGWVREHRGEGIAVNWRKK